MMKKNKKSQEEMIGFVLIVVIVVVVGLILMSLTLRRDDSSENSKEIENFLEASMLSTTNCAINFAPQYDDMQDLIKSCYEHRNCENGENSCKALNEGMNSMVNLAFPIRAGGQYDAYSMQINYVMNESLGAEILSLGDKNCSEMGAMKTIPAYPGEILVEMNLCYSE